VSLIKKQRGVILVFGVVAALLFSLTLTNPPSTGDVWSAETGAWQLGTQGTPWIDGLGFDQLPTYWQIGTVKQSLLWITTNPDNDHQVISRSPGAILPAIPAYAVANLFWPRSDGHRLSTLPGSITAIVLATLALLLLLGALLPLVGLKRALIGASVLGFTTPYWTIIGNDLWPHCIGALGICGLAWALPRERWYTAGLFGGLALLGRLHLAIIVGSAGILLALWRRDPRIALRIAATSVPFVALSSLWSHWLYGSWSPSAGYVVSDLTGWSASRSPLEHLTDYLGLFVSQGNGLLVWTPLLVVLAPSVVRSWHDAPDWTKALAVASLPYLLVGGWLNPFSGGTGFWAYRLPLESLAAWTPLLVFSAVRLGRIGRPLAISVVGLQFGMMLPGVILGLATSTSSGTGWDSNRLLQAFGEQPTVISLMLIGAITAVWLLALRVRDAAASPS